MSFRAAETAKNPSNTEAAIFKVLTNGPLARCPACARDDRQSEIAGSKVAR